MPRVVHPPTPKASAAAAAPGTPQLPGAEEELEVWMCTFCTAPLVPGSSNNCNGVGGCNVKCRARRPGLPDPKQKPEKAMGPPEFLKQDAEVAGATEQDAEDE